MLAYQSFQEGQMPPPAEWSPAIHAEHLGGVAWRRRSIERSNPPCARITSPFFRSGRLA